MKWVPSQRIPRTARHEIIAFAALAVVTLVLFRLTRLDGPFPTTMFFPPAGAVFAYLVLIGPSGIPAAAAVLALGLAASTPDPLGPDLAPAAGAALLLAKALGLAAYPLHRDWRRRRLGPRVFTVLTSFVLTGLAAAPLLSALVVHLLALIVGEPAGFGRDARLMVGTAIGIATVAPACLVLAVLFSGRSPALLRTPLDGRREALAPITLILLAPLVALCLPGTGLAELWLLPLAAAPLFWICLTGDLVRSAAVLLVSGLVIGVLGRELFGETAGFYRTQVMVLCCAVATLYVAAVCVHGAATRAEEQAATTRWRALVAAAPAVVARVGTDGVWRTERTERTEPPEPNSEKAEGELTSSPLDVLPQEQRRQVGAAVRDRHPRTLTWRRGERWFVTQVTPLPDGETLVVTTETPPVAPPGEVAPLRTHDRRNAPSNADLVTAAARRALEGGGTALVLVVDLGPLTRRTLLLGADGTTAVEAVADRVRAVLDAAVAGSLVARTGDDQLTALVPGVGELTPATTEALLAAVGTPVEPPGGPVPVHGSVGLASVHGDGPDVAETLRRAALAAQAARERGRNRVVSADGPAIHDASARARLVADVAGAVERAELELVYQPDVEPESGRLQGVEALVRWRRPDGLPVAADDFVRMAEEAGTVAAIDDWVMRASVAQLGRWRREIDLTDVELGVNVSALSLDAALPARLAAECERHAVPPSLLRLEVTETALGDDGRSIAVLRAARERGFRVALDDFGTGYASLSRLRTLPVDVIKLDRSFLVSLTDDAGAQTLVGMILGLAEPLQVDVVVEGVETRAQRDVLVELGCRRAQGFLFAPPTAPPELRELLGDPAAFRR